MTRLRIAVVLIASLAVTHAATAQTIPPATPAAAATAAQAAAPQDDPDLDFRPLEPDFTLVALPTTLRLPRFKSAFRVTHRFLRPLGQGDFGNLLEDFFGLDSGARIGEPRTDCEQLLLDLLDLGGEIGINPRRADGAQIGVQLVHFAVGIHSRIRL